MFKANSGRNNISNCEDSSEKMYAASFASYFTLYAHKGTINKISFQAKQLNIITSKRHQE